MSPEDSEKMRRVLSQGRNAVVGLNRSGRAPHLSVVWFSWDGEYLRFSITTDRIKYSLLQQDPAISLLVDDPKLGYVAAYGHAQVLTERFADAARPIAEKYMSDTFERGMAMLTAPGRVLVEFRPEHVTVH
jgi:PPOX class probable F420-dependent enzyme